MSTRIRVWPGVVAVAVQWLLWSVTPRVVVDGMLWQMGGSALCGLAVLLWWMFFSRVPHLERWGAFALIAGLGVAFRSVVDPSIRGGMMGAMFPLYAFPVVTTALVVSAAAMGRMDSVISRRAALVASLAAAFAVFTVLRTEGITGEGFAQLKWRWTPTREQKLLERAEAQPQPATATPAISEPIAAPAATPATPEVVEAAAPVAPAAALDRAAPEWPGFRGPRRDSRISGLTIRTDWASTPPVELWRKPIGPAWSSFAAGDGLIYTQEQRGEAEVVACYRLDTGEGVWSHRTPVRFWESNAGAGPRGTPTLHDGSVYALGATGVLNALDAGSGRLQWTRNVATETGAKVPEWGFSSSPLVVDDLVVVAASGYLAGYEAASGKLRWKKESVGGSYSSPHLVTLDGVEQIVMLSASGATGLLPSDGKVLWSHAWKGFGMLQPAIADGHDILITTSTAGGGEGTRRIAIAQEANGWTAKEVWTSKGLKPYFNDLVVHKGHAFGFDGGILSCIDLSDGKRKWKGGRYGHGQMVLLVDQDLLLVLSEEGEVALVSATPDEFREVAKVPALHDKTWNHPAIVRDTLLVRNGEEMVAFRLPRQ
jgi:outer membrane protein assembly factor BamB